MSIEIKECSLPNSMDSYKGVVILPSNYFAENVDAAKYSSTCLSFKKYAEGALPIEFYSEPELLYERRSGEWFSPELLITSAALAANPHLVAIACSVIANHLTELFRGKKSPVVKVRILYKKTGKTETRELTYEGDVAGLESVKDAIGSIATSDD